MARDKRSGQGFGNYSLVDLNSYRGHRQTCGITLCRRCPLAEPKRCSIHTFAMTQPSLNRTMKVITCCTALRNALADCRMSRQTIGFVPTMGALHDGHLSLVRQSKQTCQRTVVSIFVNPTQFAAGEDYEKYPRSFDADLTLLEPLEVDFVFAPTLVELYPPDFSTRVQPPRVSQVLEGEYRPTHFQGVATVVLKLFQLIQPQVAFFGQKDFQQSLVIQHMVRDLNVPVEVAVCPTLREHDGLALSSRNRYLSAAQRKIALSLYRCLQHVRTAILDGETDGQAAMAEMNQMLIDGGVNSIDYAVICNPDTLEIANTIAPPVVALIACRVGATRLIDNVLIG